MGVRVTDGGLSFVAGIDYSQFDKDAKHVEDRIGGISTATANQAKQIENFANKAAAAAAAYFSITTATNFISKIVQVRGEFEQLNVAYTTILGSKEKADKLFAETVQLAKTTPFTLTQVAQSTKQLLAYGFGAEEVTGTLSKLGDVAAGVSAPIGDIAYLYGTLKTQGRAYAQDIRQFTGRGIPIIAELAKQFDTTNENVNKLVESGKIGFPEIEKAFNSMTGAGGQFFNLMDEQSKTVTGQLSNLTDAFDQVLNSIGKSNEGLIKGGIEGLQTLVQNYQVIIDTIEKLIITYGAYKAAVITTNAFAAFNTARQVTENITKFNGAAYVTVAVTRELTVAQTLQAGAAKAAGVAQEFLNTTMLANPYVALTVGIAAMAASIYLSAQKTDYAAKAAANYVEVMGKEQFKLGQLFQTLEDTKAGTEERRKAVIAIKDAYGEYLPKMDLEKANLNQIRDAYSQVNDKLTENIALKAKAEQAQSINEDFTKQYTDAIKKITDAVAQEAGDAQAGRAAVVIGRLLAQAQAGKINIGARQGQLDYLKQLTGKDSAFDGGITKYLNDLQLIVNSQINAKRSLDAFYKGVDSVTKTGGRKISAAQQAAIDFAKALEKPLENFDTLMKNQTGKKDLEAIAKALNDQLDIPGITAQKIGQIKTLQDRVDQALAIYSRKTEKKLQSQEETEQQRRNAIFEKVAKLNEGALQDSKSQDEKEVLQARSKYDELIREIDRYNKDKRNKLKLDAGNIVINGKKTNLNDAANTAGENVKAEQSFKKDKELYDAKKILFTEYEKYKDDVGSELADKRFSKDLEGYTSFVGYLEGLLNSVAGKTDKKSILIQDFLKTALPDARNQAIKDQQAILSDLLRNNLDYETKRKALIQKAEKEIADLRKAGEDAIADQLVTNTVEQLTALDEANVKTTTAYKELFDGLQVISDAAARKDIEALRKLLAARLKAGTITKEAYLQLKKELDDLSVALDSKAGDRLLSIGAGLQNIAQNLTGVNEEFGTMISSLGKLAASIGSIQKLGIALKNAKTDEERFTATANLAIAGISGAVQLVDTLINSASQRKAAERAYYDSVLSSQNQVNLSLNEEIRLRAQLNSNVFLKDYKADIISASLALDDANKKFAQSLIALQNGQAKTGTRNKVDAKSIANSALGGAAAGASIGAAIGTAIPLPIIGTVAGAVGGAIIGGIAGAISGLFGGKKKVDEFSPLLKEFPELIGKDKNGVDQLNVSLAKNLIANNLVSDSTKVLLQNTIDLNDARQAAIDQINTDIKELAGSLGDDLRSALVQAFKDGTDAAIAFGDSVGKVIENIVSQFLFQEIFGGEFDKLQARMKASFGIKGDQNLVDDLTEFFKNAGPLVQSYEDALKQAQIAAGANGIKILQPSGSTGGQNSLQGSIKASLTEATGEILAGTLKGIQAGVYETVLTLKGTGLTYGQMLIIAQQALDLAIKIEANTLKTATNSDALPAMLSELQTINSNTKGSLDIDLRAAGFYKY